MDKEEVKYLKELKAKVRLNLIFVLADIIGSEMMEVQSFLNANGKDFHRKDKMNFNLFKSSAKSFQRQSDEIASIIYDGPMEKDACADSDYLQDILELIIDKVGENKDDLAKFRAMIYNMESKNHVFNK